METLTPWTEAREMRAEALWLEGRSGSYIARDLGGTTRCAVMGKLRRLGRLGVGKPRKAKSPRARIAAQRIARSTPRSQKRKPFTDMCRDAAEPASLCLDLLSLPVGACRWIAGDPRADGTCCGHAAAEGRPYCTHHTRRAYRWEAR